MSRDKGENDVSKLDKFSPPKLLEVFDNVEKIWDTMKRRFPKTAVQLCDMERIIQRAESIKNSFQYREIETQISLSDSASDFVDVENADNDYESLNEWSQVVDDSFHEHPDSPKSLPIEVLDRPDTAEDNPLKEALVEIDKLSNLQNFYNSEQIYDETIATISSMKLIEKKESDMKQRITTRDTVLAPVQQRIASYEDKPKPDDDCERKKQRSSTSSPLRESEDQKPSHIPVRSPRSPRSQTSPRESKSPEKSPRSRNAKLKSPQKQLPLFNQFASKNSCNRMFQKCASTKPPI